MSAKPRPPTDVSRAQARLAWHKRRKLKSEYVNMVKMTRGCKDCGYNQFVEALEFDHVKGEKTFGIAKRLGNITWELLARELDKCEVVCSNCHRIRTFLRRNPRQPKPSPF